MARSVSAIAHAKVNLHLGVGPLREDGYHELVTVFQSLSLHDELTLTEVDGEGPVASLDAHGNPEVPEDDRNLAWRAVEKLSAWHRDNGGDALPAVAIDLLKGIPTAGGMAGGSADAAATLRAYNALLPVAAASDPGLSDYVTRIDTETDIVIRADQASQLARLLWQSVDTIPLYQTPELVAVRTGLANVGADGYATTTWEDVGWQA